MIENKTVWLSHDAWMGRCTSLAVGQALAIRLTEACPRWDEPLSATKNTRRAEASSSVVMTCSTSRENGTIPLVSSQRPSTRAWWTSSAARQANAPRRSYSRAMPIGWRGPGGRLGWQRQRAWMEAFSSVEITYSGLSGLPLNRSGGGRGRGPGRPWRRTRGRGGYPRTVVPRLDRVRRQPPPDRGVRDRRDDALLDRGPRQIGTVPACQRSATDRRQLTCERFDLHHDVWGGTPRGVPPSGGHPAPPGAARRTACATSTPPAVVSIRAAISSLQSPSAAISTIRAGPLRRTLTY